MAANILLVLVSILLTTSYAVTPGTLFDLSDFSLQLPVNDDGGITTIKQPKLRTFTDPTYFHVDGDSVVMFVPENGVLTDNGSGPRTELTEPREFFTFSGVHHMSYVTKVTHADYPVCVGQLKGDSYKGGKFDGNMLIVVEIVYSPKSGELISHFRDKDSNGVKLSLGKFALNDPINIDIKVDGYKVYVSSQQITLKAYDYSFWQGHSYKMHFKVGAYLQGKGKSSSKGARIELSNFQTSHAKLNYHHHHEK